MGGLFTIVKVRDELQSYDGDPGWYQHPSGTVALKATDGDLARDGIDVNEGASPPAPRPVDTGPPAPSGGHRH
jgi:hypothetical protein